MNKIYYNFSSFDDALNHIKTVSSDFEDIGVSVQNLSIDVSEIADSFENAKKSTKTLIDNITQAISIEISRAQNVKDEQISNDNSLANELLQNETLNNLVTDNIYVIQSGDTLTHIAQKNNVSLDQLIEANESILSNPNLIYVGNVLTIPDSNMNLAETLTSINESDTNNTDNNEIEYTVQDGDNLSKIANKFNVSLSDLITSNSSILNDLNIITTGTILCIPKSSNSLGSSVVEKEDISESIEVLNQQGIVCSDDSFVIEIPQEMRPCVTTYMNWNRIGTGGKSNQDLLRTVAYNNGDVVLDSDGFYYINDGTENRYLVAMSETYGNVGDYVDVSLSDGTTLKCIIGDIKSVSDSNYNQYGHLYASSKGSDLNVLEYITNWPKDHDNPWKVRSELGGVVLSVTNTGNRYIERTY